MNYLRIAPERYKLGVIKTLLHRAYKICSSYESLHVEMEWIRQLLTNNNFPINVIDGEIGKFLDRKASPDTNTTAEGSTISLFYRNQMSSQYKQEEENFKKIISDYITPTDANNKIQFNFFIRIRNCETFSSKLTSHSNLNNNDVMEKSRVVHILQCDKHDCQNPAPLLMDIQNEP